MLQILDGPILLKESRLFYPCSLDKLEESPKRSPENGNGSLYINNIVSPLYPSLTLDELVDFIGEINKEDFLKGVRKEVDDLIKESKVKNVNKFLDNWKDESQLIYTIIFKLMPCFVSFNKEDKLKKALEGKSTKVSEQEFLDNLVNNLDKKKYHSYLYKAEEVNLEDLNEVEAKLKAISYKDPWDLLKEKTKKVNKKEDKQNRIREVVRKIYGFKNNDEIDRHFLIYKNQLFRLNENNDSKTGVILNGKRYSTNEICRIDLNKLILDSVKQKMLFRERDNLLKNINDFRKSIEDESALRKVATLLYFKDISSFELEDFGFDKRDNGYCIYIKTPEYVLRDPSNNNELYLFPKTKIGTRISLCDGKVRTGSPYTLCGGGHPFTGDSSGKICLGHYSWSSHEYTLERCIESLLIGKKVIMNGYREGRNPSCSLSDFSSRRISKNHPKLKSGKVKITNLK